MREIEDLQEEKNDLAAGWIAADKTIAVQQARIAELEAENKRLKQILGLCYWGLDNACTALDHHKIGSTTPLCILQNSITDELGGVPYPPYELEVKGE